QYGERPQFVRVDGVPAVFSARVRLLRGRIHSPRCYCHRIAAEIRSAAVSHLTTRAILMNRLPRKPMGPTHRLVRWIAAGIVGIAIVAVIFLYRLGYFVADNLPN